MGLWANMRGPIKFLYVDVFRESRVAMGIGLFSFLLTAIQIALLAVKMGGEDKNEEKLDGLVEATSSSALPWAVVFLPAWLLFLLACASPGIGCVPIGAGLYVVLMLFLWTPLFFLFCCLAVKLTALDNNSSNGNIPMSVIFLPFWIIEAVVMLYTLGLLVFNIYRYHRGTLDRRLEECVGLFISVWVLLSPFVIFQSLMSASDDGSHAVDAAGVVAPLLVVLGWTMLASCLFATRYRTASQEAANHNAQELLRVSNWLEV